MKKSVVILIGIIYAASIMLVTFYGLVTENLAYDSIDISKIDIVGDGVVVYGDNQKYYEITTPIPENGVLTYQIEYSYSPNDATNTNVIFEIDNEDSAYAMVSETGLVTIFKSGNGKILVKIYATDGEGNRITSVMDELWISYPK